MLKKLTVSNLAVVERAEARFTSGLNVLTGETGAGKSVLMGALELVLGGRADAGIVRDGVKEAEVEADFGDTVIRRTITSQGRSRAWVNDESVAIAELREIGKRLVDVHGPTANQKMLEERFQRETVDSFGSLGATLKEYSTHWRKLEALKAHEAEMLRGGGEDELDLLRFQVGELSAAELSEADETIAERHAAAAHAEDILENANAVMDTLGGDFSVAGMLAKLQPRFAKMARHLPAAGVWSSEAEEIAVRLQDLSRAVADEVSKLDVGEESLTALDARLTLVNRLERKYRVGNVAQLIALLAMKRERLSDLEGRDGKLEKLRKQMLEVSRMVKLAGMELSRRRRVSATKFAAAVTGELHDLGFLQAKFFVQIDSVEPTEHGMDRVVFMFEPNPGESARPLASIASSGEIARVMLALKSVLAAHDATEVLVFDEIDANIGGEVGRVVGEKMKAVAKHHQVIAITHLPQSAVYGDCHLVVSKTVSGGRTRTTISEVEGEHRILEIARMLGGEKITSVVKRHAEEMLRLPN